MIKTYRGSCHCGAIRFEVDLDLAVADTYRCNCSICTKTRAWKTIVKPDALRVIAGADTLSRYRFHSRLIHHLFCKHCGVHPFEQGYAGIVGGHFISLNLACLDDAVHDELINAPLRYRNGRDNEWQEAPAEVRHL